MKRKAEIRGECAGQAPVQRSKELHWELTTVNRMISRGKLQNARIEDSELKYSRDKTSIPEGVKEFTQKVYEQVPLARLIDLLVEVASWTGFTQHFTDLNTGEPAKDLKPILAAILPAPRQIVS